MSLKYLLAFNHSSMIKRDHVLSAILVDIANSPNYRSGKVKFFFSGSTGPPMVTLLGESITSKNSVNCYEPRFHPWENVILLYFFVLFSENSFLMRKYI